MSGVGMASDDAVAARDERTLDEREQARRYSMFIAWSPEDGIYIVSVPELPGLHTHGRTHEQAVAMGEDAIATWLAGLRWMGFPLPEPQFASVDG